MTAWSGASDLIVSARSRTCPWLVAGVSLRAMPLLLRVLSGLWIAGFVVLLILLVYAPDAARFGAVGLALVFSAVGLTMATDAGGTARWIGQTATFGPGIRTPEVLRSPKVTRIWGAICFVVGLAIALQAVLDDDF